MSWSYWTRQLELMRFMKTLGLLAAPRRRYRGGDQAHLIVVWGKDGRSHLQ